MSPGTDTAATDRVEHASKRAITVLNHVLRPLRDHYERPEVEEIVICAPQVAFEKLRVPDRAGRWWRKANDPRFTYSYLLDVAHAVANTYDLSFHPKSVPTVYATLPGNHRYTAAAGVGIQYGERLPHGGVMMAIRQAPRGDRKARLEDWQLRPGSQLGIQKSALRKMRKRPPDAYRAVYEAAQSGHPLLFSGPTSSGKTTLLNMLLEETDENLRIVTVEDARELRVRNPNRMHILVESTAVDRDAPQGTLRQRDIIQLVLRSTPDAILIGEIQATTGACAFELLKSGHSHFWCSIHAGHPEQAYVAFAERIAHTLGKADKNAIIAELRATMTVIQTQKEGGLRTVSHVVTPDDGAGAEQSARYAAPPATAPAPA